MNLDVFIKGELINLCIPTQDFVLESNWYNWFNSPKTNRFLEQGAFPNTKSDQLLFFNTESKNKSRLILIISDKEKYIGTVSLSFINHEKKTASVAIVIGENSSKHENSHLMALESMSLITEHGFTLLGLIRIDAGQHRMLHKWQQRLELLGYKAEGIKKNGFVKGIERSDSISIAVTLDEYLVLKKNRGRYWDSASLMNSRINKLPAETFYSKLSEFLNKEGKKYYSDIFSL
jgi:RimJ/RimL family protein N-acetyltransferase